MDFSFLKQSSYKNIVVELTRQQVKTQYRDSSLGFLWTVLNPLLNMLVMWVVFSSVLQINDPYYPIYLLTGTILFSCLRNSTFQAMESIVNNRGLLLRTKISLSIFPMSNILSSIVNFLFSFIALIPFMIWLTLSPELGINLFTYRLSFILLMIPALALFEFGLGLLLSAVFVFFRDLKHLYTVFLTLWTYSTPIFYSMAGLDNTTFFYKVVKFNPMFHFLNYFRDCVYRGAVGVDFLGENIGSYLPGFGTLGLLYLLGLGALVVGISVFELCKNAIITRI